MTGSRSPSSPDEGVRLRPIALADAATCVAFRRDMYATAFGTTEGLEELMGPGDARYVAELRERLETFPEGNVHAWQAGEIVGQLEMRLLQDEPDVGYVSLVYVAPRLRGHGLGRRLHEHAAQAARERAMRRMRLSVAITNEPAIAFYRRIGWDVVGTRPNVQPMAIMEFTLG